MRTLLLRLSALDAEAEGAVRVISVFDTLLRQDVGPARLARMTAQLAECPVGISAAVDGPPLRVAPDGHRLAGDPPAWATRCAVDGGGEVWLERRGTPLSLDAIVLERFAAAAAIVRGLQHSTRPPLGDPALVELVIGDRADAPERSRALHLMGLTPASRVRVLAVAGDVPDALASSPDLAAHVPIQDLHAALLVGAEVPPLHDVAGVRVGVGAVARADEAWQSWRGARLAVRFAAAAATPAPGLHGGPVVHVDDLGAFAVLAEYVPVESISGIGDVRALDRLAAARGGALMIATLHAACLADSVRTVGHAMHLHHSSVAARLARAEDELGFGVRTAVGRSRLAVALTLRHLRDHPN